MKKLFILLLLLLSLALLCSCGQNAPIDAESTTEPTTEAAPTSAATIVTEPLAPVVSRLRDVDNPIILLVLPEIALLFSHCPHP